MLELKAYQKEYQKKYREMKKAQGNLVQFKPPEKHYNLYLLN